MKMITYAFSQPFFKGLNGLSSHASIESFRIKINPVPVLLLRSISVSPLLSISLSQRAEAVMCVVCYSIVENQLVPC